MIGKSDLSQRDAYFLNPALSPGFGKPVWSKNPPGYSINSGLAVGRRGRRENGFVTNAPNESSGIPARRSGANPNDPAAFMSGLLKYKSRFIINKETPPSLLEEGSSRNYAATCRSMACNMSSLLLNLNSSTPSFLARS